MKKAKVASSIRKGIPYLINLQFSTVLWVSIALIAIIERHVQSIIHSSPSIAGLSLRAGGRGIPLATTSLSPGYFETKPKHWKVKNTSNNKIVNKKKKPFSLSMQTLIHLLKRVILQFL